MSTLRTSVSRFVVLSLLFLAACGVPAPDCDSRSCPFGCCDLSGVCQQPGPATCGSQGNACLSCPSGQSCQLGMCLATASGGGTGSSGRCTSSAECATGWACEAGQCTLRSVIGGGGGVGGDGGAVGGGGGAVGGGSGAALPMRVFITSVAGPGNIGGLAGADARCDAAARAANKGGTWKAWLSTASEAAHSRQADVGPWHQQSADGGLTLTFNNKANLSTTPIAAISVDEMGRYTGAEYWTGTSGGGQASDSTCSGWTSASSNYFGTIGNGSTSTAWTSSTSAYCYDFNALLCFEQNHLPLPPPPPTSRKRLFITSVAFTGDLGGLAQADARCNTAAQAANKTGTWKAWLSSPSESAASRQTDVGPWHQESADGGLTLTFNNKANLTTTPLAPITVDEMGRYNGAEYWTGTTGGGLSSSATCSGWTSASSSFFGTFGNGATSTAWTITSSDYCHSAHALLCLEQ
ncbi:MAG: DUF1554 domain-containing protein [Archangium sp.]|nr:DUF1554 domain-containing protein [Archangium sp.]